MRKFQVQIQATSLCMNCMSHPEFNQISEPSQHYNANFYSICFIPLKLGCKQCPGIKEVRCSPHIL